jgi:alpha-L-fucosidase
MQIKALEGIGAWLQVNGEAIYGTRPWKRFGDTMPNGGEVRYTSKGDALYAIVTTMPNDGVLTLPADVGPRAELLGRAEELEVTNANGIINIHLPEQQEKDAIPVLKI